MGHMDVNHSDHDHSGKKKIELQVLTKSKHNICLQLIALMWDSHQQNTIIITVVKNMIIALTVQHTII